MCKKLAKIDQFGFQIQLSYRKENKYGTSMGGCCTIVYMVFFWAISLTLIF